MPDDLFEWAEQSGAEAGAQAKAAAAKKREVPADAVVFGVAELSRTLKAHVEGGPFADVWVEGEVTGLSERNGTLWLQLKDPDAILKAVVWPSARRGIEVDPREGDRVLCHGRIDLYTPRGEYRLVVDKMLARGLGALLAARRAVEERLAAEGLLDPGRKRRLPFLPRRVGLVTSPTGAAVRDFLRAAELRFPRLDVVLAPCRVQGDGAARTVVAALSRLRRLADVDVVVVTRGGGSVEDLWAFNDEELARAIAACPVPVVSAVGHERDHTVADLVADARASTPSAAAVAVFPVLNDLQEALRTGGARLGRAVRRRADDARARLDLLFEKARRGERRHAAAALRAVETLRARLQGNDPQRRLAQQRAALGDLRARLARRAPTLTPQRRRAVERLAEQLRAGAAAPVPARRAEVREIGARLEALSPRRVLDRGWALVRDEGGHVVTDAERVAPGARLDVTLRRGGLDVTVTGRRESEAGVDGGVGGSGGADGGGGSDGGRA